MTPKRRASICKKAAKAFDTAWEAMSDLHELFDDCGIPIKHHDIEFRRQLRERAERLENPAWLDHVNARD